MSWFDIVLLFRSPETLVEAHFSCAEQGEGVGCVDEVLVRF